MAADPTANEQARHRLLIDSVSDYAIFMLDPDGIIQSWNTGAERMKGYRADEVVGSHFSRFYTAEALARGWPAHELRTAREVGRFEDEGWRVRKDGVRFWANVVITPMRDEQGVLIGFAKVVRDLTERRRHDEALRISEERFRLLVESVQDYAIFMLDPDGIVASWNIGAQRMKGYRPDEIIGSHFARFYTQEALVRGWPEHELVVARTDGRFEDEGWRVRKDGSHFWANVVITALRDASGKLHGFAKVTRDLSERRKVASLEQAGRHTLEFLAMLGHELRNPLGPIRNAAEIIGLRASADPAIGRARDIIDRQVNHLGRLVDDLLDVGRIATGKVALQREAVDLAAVIGAAIDSVQPMAIAKRQQIERVITGDELLVDGDQTRLTQVMVNLLTNAIKYTPDGGHLRVELERTGPWLQVRVSDDGMGIPIDMLTRVFELFVQGPRTLERADGGLGIGLTVVRRLVELHGGTISASSRGPGLGSSFLVRLPALAARVGADPTAGAAAAVAAPPRLRVLVVDDNRDAAEMVAMLIELWGYDVTVAHDGTAALAAATAARPDLVLLDIGLPGMDGYAVAERLLRLYPADPPLLAAMTGYGQDEDKRRTRDAGFAAHLVKPVQPDRLKDLLASLAPRATGVGLR